MEYLLVFLFSCVIEACGTGYTLLITRGRLANAFLLGRIVSILNIAIILGVINNNSLVLPLFCGEALGDAAALGFGRWKKIA